MDAEEIKALIKCKVVRNDKERAMLIIEYIQKEQPTREEREEFAEEIGVEYKKVCEVSSIVNFNLIKKPSSVYSWLERT
jgi:anaerobic ribonucleoside-triphosphate reductase